MQRKQPSIVCVDDDPGILAALKRVLCDDFKVMTATSAEDAAQILDDHPDVTVVVSDFHMPGVNGIDLLEWCRIHHSHVVRVALTGYPDSDLMKAALNTGLASCVIPKPWDDGQIIQILTAVAEYPGGAS